MTKDQLVEQLKSNCERVKKYRVTHDQVIKFRELYNCFENMGELETGKKGKAMIASLKKDQNEIKAVFHRMLNNRDFCETLKNLKSYSQIKNNTKEVKEVVINDEKDFNTMIEAIYTIRHNLAHGNEGNTQKDKKILRVVNRIFEKIVFGARLKYLS
jgi:hypothetical protein